MHQEDTGFYNFWVQYVRGGTQNAPKDGKGAPAGKDGKGKDKAGSPSPQKPGPKAKIKDNKKKQGGGEEITTVELGTINPFFGQESHLPPSLSKTGGGDVKIKHK